MSKMGNSLIVVRVQITTTTTTTTMMMMMMMMMMKNTHGDDRGLTSAEDQLFFAFEATAATPLGHTLPEPFPIALTARGGTD